MIAGFFVSLGLLFCLYCMGISADSAGTIFRNPILAFFQIIGKMLWLIILIGLSLCIIWVMAWWGDFILKVIHG